MKTESPCWYVMRATYGRERVAFDYIVGQGGEAFYPTTFRKRVTADGKAVLEEKSLLPNLFFVRATRREAQSFAHDNIHLPFLRFYYEHHHDGRREPLVVPNCQIDELRLLCRAKADDTLFVPGTVSKFNVGQRVRIVAGKFKGLCGVLARWSGQQRVGITLSGIGIVATAYVPSAFLEPVESESHEI